MRPSLSKTPASRWRHLIISSQLLCALAAFPVSTAHAQEESTAPQAATTEADDSFRIDTERDEAYGLTPRPTDLFPGLAALIEKAERQSPQILAELYGEEENKANLDVVKSARGPRVSATGRIQAQGETRINSHVSGGDDFNVLPVVYTQATLPLYHWGEFDAKMELAKIRTRLARLSTAQRAAQLSQDVSRNYVELQLARKALSLASESVEAAEQRVKIQQAMFDNGQGAKRNLLEAKIYLQERTDDVIATENAVANYELVLRTLCNDENLEIETEEFPDFALLSPEELSKLEYMARNPELMLGREAIAGQLAAEKANFKDLSTRNKPKLDLVSSVYLDSVDEWRGESYDTVPRLIGFVGLQATWQLYDHGELSAYKRSSMARQRKLEAQMTQARLQHERDVSAMARDLELNARRLATRNERLELLKETVGFLEQQADSGNLPENDLQDRMLELERTRLDLLRAKANYLLGVTALRSYAEPLAY